MQPIEFRGSPAIALIAGQMTMFGDRLTDFLNGQERFRIHHVEFESLDDGHRLAVDSVSVERDDLLAVVATGPRGSEKARGPPSRAGCRCPSGRTSCSADCIGSPARTS